MKKVLFLMLCAAIAWPLQAQDTLQHHRLIVATGEYQPVLDWHSILRFDQADTIDSKNSGTNTVPGGVIPIKQCLDDTVALNFAHGIFHDAPNRRTYVSTLFTNPWNAETVNTDTAWGSIAVFDNIELANGPTPPTRHLFGDSTGLMQPHGVWVDTLRDILYVPNTFGGNILVWDNASAVDGNVPPDRIISSGKLSAAVHIFVDVNADIMFVANMPSFTVPGTSPSILIYANASTLNGNVDPNLRIVGNEARLHITNRTVHNLWWRPDIELLAVGHHTNELLFFDLSTFNFLPPTSTDTVLAPRVIQVNDSSDQSDTLDWSLYGIWWDTEADLMYLSTGYTPNNGGPPPNSPDQTIKVYSGLSDPSKSGWVAPDRRIWWSNGHIYWPPQPLWVEYWEEIVPTALTEATVTAEPACYPNPGGSEVYMSLPGLNGRSAEVHITDLSGREVARQSAERTWGGTYRLRVDGLPEGMYLLKVDAEGYRHTIKFRCQR